MSRINERLQKTPLCKSGLRLDCFRLPDKFSGVLTTIMDRSRSVRRGFSNIALYEPRRALRAMITLGGDKVKRARGNWRGISEFVALHEDPSRLAVNEGGIALVVEEPAEYVTFQDGEKSWDEFRWNHPILHK